MTDGQYVTQYVTHHGDFEDCYRRSDGDEFGYPVPAELVDQLEAAERALRAANDAIQNYLEDNAVAEVEIPD